jgi:hypothetical protein
METHIVSQSAPEDAEKEAGPKDFPAEHLFHDAATNALSTYPVVRYTPKFLHGEGGAELVIFNKMPVGNPLSSSCMIGDLLACKEKNCPCEYATRGC